MDIQTLHDAAREVARIAGATAASYFRSGVAIETKADATPVTEADRAAERVARAAIERRFPNHTILGEEYGGAIEPSGLQWILDPIDGTKSFVRGVPLFTTLVAVCDGRTPLVGVIFNPITGELVSALDGGGAFDERGRRVSVSGTARLADAWTGVTDPVDFARRAPRAWEALVQGSASMRTWADAYGYLLLARGDLDLMIDPIMSPWDIAPLGVIVREAGGTFTDVAGNRNDLGDSCIAAASSELHAEVRAYF